MLTEQEQIEGTAAEAVDGVLELVETPWGDVEGVTVFGSGSTDFVIADLEDHGRKAIREMYEGVRTTLIEMVQQVIEDEKTSAKEENDKLRDEITSLQKSVKPVVTSTDSSVYLTNKANPGWPVKLRLINTPEGVELRGSFVGYGRETTVFAFYDDGSINSISEPEGSFFDRKDNGELQIWSLTSTQWQLSKLSKSR